MFWTADEIAAEVGLTPAQVRLICRESKENPQKYGGRIGYFKGRQWWFGDGDLLLLQQRPKPGRPPKNGD